MIYRFHTYELDIDRHELRDAGAVAPIQPQVFEVLAYLIAQRRRVVSKQELLDHLWPEHFVSDNTLHQRLTTARRAIGDSSREQACIKTLRGLGYRFVAPVEEDMEATRVANTHVRQPIVAVSDRTEVSGVALALSPEVERRQMTILCCNLVDTVSLANQLAHQDMEALIRAYHRTCADIIQQANGYIAQSQGDRLLAYFGYPQAREDDVQQAVQVGLHLLDTVETLPTQLQRQQGIHLALRVGIHTDLMVIGERGASGEQVPLALGEGLHVAERLQGIAAPQTVMVSATTHRVVAGYFTWEIWGKHALSGVPEPIAVYRALRRSGAQSRLDIAGPRGLTPLVGRQQEVGLLLERWEQVCEGRGQVVVLSGEAGIGKSRLTQILTEHVECTGATCTVLRCSPSHMHSALYPLIQHLESLLHSDGAGTSADKIARLERLIEALNLPRAEVLPWFASLLSIPYHDRVMPVPLTPQQQRQKIHNALVAWLLAAANPHPALLVWEDLHWADPSTLELLGLIIEQVPMAQMLMLLTCRLEFHPPWTPRSHLTSLTLNGLPRTQTAALAQHVAGGIELPAVLLDQIVTKTDGVPLFVEELTKALLESGGITEADGADDVIDSSLSLSIPATLQDSLMARLDRLGSAKGVAQHGAILGRQFSYTLLHAITQIDETRLQQDLQQLVGAELLYQRGEPPQATYTFKHALIQDMAYHSLLRWRQQALHREVGEAIEALYPEHLAEHAEALAYHFTHGEAWPKALDYCVLAGDRATATYANAEARAHYERALEAAGKLAVAPDPATLARLHETHAEILTALAEDEAAVTAYQRALELTRQSGDQRRESHVLAGLSNVYNWYHRPEQAMAYNDQALALARALDDRPAQATCLINRAAIRCVYYGQVSATLPDAEEALRLARALGKPKLLAQSLSNFGATLQWHADFDRSLAYLHEGVVMAQRAHSGFDFGRAAFHLGIANTTQGLYDEALQWLQQLSDYATAAGDPFWLARLPNTLGGVYLEAFDLDEALRLNLEGAEAAQQYWPWPEPQAHALLKVGLAHFERGDYGQAEAFFRRTWALLDEDIFLRWRWHIPLLRARGELALVMRQYDQAEHYATQSMDMAVQTAARKHVIRAQRLQGDILAARGHLTEAAQTLRTAIRHAKRLRTARELWQSYAALGKVLLRLGQDKVAESSFRQAIQTIEAIATDLQMPSLRRSLLHAAPILEVYALVGGRPPPVAH